MKPTARPSAYHGRWPLGYVFDLNGTLVPLPPRGVSAEGLAECARILNVAEGEFNHWWRESFRERNIGTWGCTTEDYFKNLLAAHSVTRPRTTIEDAAESRRNFARRTVRLPSASRRCLERLRKLRYRIGMITACGSSLPEVWAELDVSEWIDSVQFSALAGMMKPDRRCYESICAELNIPTTGCVYVGDGAGDELEGAQDAGCIAVYFQPPDAPLTPWSNMAWDGLRIVSFNELPLAIGDS